MKKKFFQDTLFEWTYIILLYRTWIDFSNYAKIELGSIISNTCLILSIMLIFFQFLIDSILLLKVNKVTIVFALFCVVIIVMLIGSNIVAPTVLLLLLLARNAPKKSFEKIAKISMYGNAFSGLFIWISMEAGIIPETEIGGRLSGGFENPNAFGFFVCNLFIIIYLAMHKKRTSSILLVGIVIAFLSFNFCGSRTSFAGLMIFTILCFVDNYMFSINKVINKHRIVKILYRNAFIIAMTVSYLIAAVYKKNTSASLTIFNITLSHRPYLWSRHIDQIPFTFLGKEINQRIGSLDNAYLSIYIGYGFLGAVLYYIFFYYVARQTLKEGNSILTIIYVVTIVYMIMEGIPISPFLNILFLYGFIAFWKIGKKEKIKNISIESPEARR